MKVIYPQAYARRRELGRYRETLKETFKGACAILMLLSAAVLLHVSFLGRMLDDSILKTFLSFEKRFSPNSVIIVRFADLAAGRPPVVDFPTPERLAEIYRVAALAQPRAIITDFSLGDDLLSKDSSALIATTLSSLKSAVASEVSRSTDTKAVVRFSTSPVIERVTTRYDITQDYAPVRNLNFSSEDWSDAPFLGALASITGKSAPTDLSQKLINFYGPPGTIANILASDLTAANAEALASKLKGRIVFFGYQTIPARSGPLKGDREIYSSNVRMSDTEIRATIVANVLDDTFVSLPSNKWQIIILCSLLVLILAVGALSGPANAALPIACIVTALAYAACLLLLRSHTWVPGLGIVAVVACIALIFNWMKPDLDQNSWQNFGKCKF